MKNTAAMVLVCNDEYWLPYALEGTRGLFAHYVIYDVGSTDQTSNIIDWFVETQKHQSTFFTRVFPEVPHPSVQGTFRNSMIAEGERDWYYLIDGDEVYSEESCDALNSFILSAPHISQLYGVVSRIEYKPNLLRRYADVRTHHRLYRKSAIWKGSHPGEAAVYRQNSSREFYVYGACCAHFHNLERSSQSDKALKRKDRLSQKTYHPGELVETDLLKELPILQKPIGSFPVAPALKALQDAY